jgi:fatty acid amide hydrolase 2
MSLRGISVFHVEYVLKKYKTGRPVMNSSNHEIAVHHSTTSSSTKILNMDATTLAKKIREGEITSTEAVETYIKHIQSINPSINALVEDRFKTAISEANKADQLIKEGNISGKLFGVPISIKEALNVAGMKTTGGLISRKNNYETEDAEAVAKLKAEGAIVIGKTNTPELCFCQESENKLYGRTNNPWDVRRTAGGSSGGEGALIAAGGAAVGVGSDIGGSIRFPSHFNGVIGFKPGNRQVSQQGSFPYVEDPFQERMLGIGPIAKSIEDVELVYSIIANEKASEKNLSEFNIAILAESQPFPLGDETQSILNSTHETLREEYNTERTDPPFFNESARIWQEIMSINGGRETEKVAFGDAKPHTIREYVKEMTSGNSDLHRYLTWAMIGAKLFKPSQKRISEITIQLEKGDIVLNDFLKNRILILPVYHVGALNHGDVYKEIFSIKKTFLKYMPFVAYANVWGLPVLTVPVGVDHNGMPIGIQIISQIGNEDAIFQLGKIMADKYRGYIRCDKHDSRIN